MKPIKQKLGQLTEHYVIQLLKAKGLKFIQQNYYCRLGEIDIIMQDKETLVFIEVRLRTSTDYHSALESIDTQKQQKLTKTAEYYLQSHGLTDKVPCRFDVVTIDWMRNVIEG